MLARLSLPASVSYPQPELLLCLLHSLIFRTLDTQTIFFFCLLKVVVNISRHCFQCLRNRQTVTPLSGRLTGLTLFLQTIYWDKQWSPYLLQTLERLCAQLMAAGPLGSGVGCSQHLCSCAVSLGDAQTLKTLSPLPPRLGEAGLDHGLEMSLTFTWSLCLNFPLCQMYVLPSPCPLWDGNPLDPCVYGALLVPDLFRRGEM